MIRETIKQLIIAVLCAQLIVSPVLYANADNRSLANRAGQSGCSAFLAEMAEKGIDAVELRREQTFPALVGPPEKEFVRAAPELNTGATGHENTEFAQEFHDQIVATEVASQNRFRKYKRNRAPQTKVQRKPRSSRTDPRPIVVVDENGNNYDYQSGTRFWREVPPGELKDRKLQVWVVTGKKGEQELFETVTDSQFEYQPPGETQETIVLRMTENSRYESASHASSGFNKKLKGLVAVTVLTAIIGTWLWMSPSPKGAGGGEAQIVLEATFSYGESETDDNDTDENSPTFFVENPNETSESPDKVAETHLMQKQATTAQTNGEQQSEQSSDRGEVAAAPTEGESGQQDKVATGSDAVDLDDESLPGETNFSQIQSLLSKRTVSGGAGSDLASNQGPSFFGISYDSANSMVFLTDTSESMNSNNKLGLLKAEFVRAIDKLPAKCEFGVLPFDSNCRPWNRDLVSASTTNKEAAKRFILGLRASGETNMLAALQVAFQMKPEVIFLLSDGTPTTGTSDSILKLIDQHSGRHLTIHTIVLPGQGSNEAYMRKIAEDNRGTIVVIGQDGKLK